MSTKFIGFEEVKGKRERVKGEFYVKIAIKYPFESIEFIQKLFCSN